MGMRRDYDIKVLNGLIETTLDSAEGYREAGRETPHTDHRRVFEQCAAERLRLVQDLQGQVRILGGAAEARGSVLAAAHRVFLDLRDRVAGGEQGMIEEIERGEDYLDRKFAKALADDKLSPAVHDTIARAYASVKAGKERVVSLRQAVPR